MPVRDARWSKDDAVSPVVGMVLVLGISVVGIAAILYWGLPAIDEMKANVEHRSLESQFQELDSTIKELVAGTTEKTAKRWQPTLNRGQVGVVNESEGWVYAVVPYSEDNDYNFAYGGFADDDNSFTITIPAGGDSLSSMRVEAYRVNGTTSGQDLIVSQDANAATAMTAVSGWDDGETQTFYLFDGPSATDDEVPIANATIRLRVMEEGAIVGEAWFVPTGRVDYRLDAGVAPKTVSANNGAVLTGNGDTFALVNAPPIPPASTTSGITRHFARAVVINGTTSFAGDDRFNVLVTLYSTYTLASGYDCAEEEHTDCVEVVQIYSFGEYAAPWYAYLSSTTRGYPYEVKATEAGAETIEYLEDTGTSDQPWMGYTLLQSTVQLTGSA